MVYKSNLYRIFTDAGLNLRQLGQPCLNMANDTSGSVRMCKNKSFYIYFATCRPTIRGTFTKTLNFH